MTESNALSDQLILHYGGRYYLLGAHDRKPGEAPKSLVDRAARAINAGSVIARLPSDAGAGFGMSLLIDLPFSSFGDSRPPATDDLVVLKWDAGPYVSFDPRDGQPKAIPDPIRRYAGTAFAGGTILGITPRELGSMIGVTCVLVDVGAGRCLFGAGAASS